MVDSRKLQPALTSILEALLKKTMNWLHDQGQFLMCCMFCFGAVCLIYSNHVVFVYIYLLTCVSNG